jgi:hypothetical protein
MIFRRKEQVEREERIAAALDAASRQSPEAVSEGESADELRTRELTARIARLQSGVKSDRRLMTIALIAIVALYIRVLAALPPPPSARPSELAILGILAAHESSLLLTMVGTIGFFCRRMNAKGRKLAETGDLRVAGTLVECLQTWPGFSVRMDGTIRDALTRLLVLLKQEDANLLDQSQCARFRFHLSERKRREGLLGRTTQSAYLNRAMPFGDATDEYIAAALGALGRIGDRKAAGPARKLLRLREKSPSADRIRAAARECLALLEARAAGGDPRETLLRASDAPEQASAELLRPAAAADPAADNLLRPAGNADE